MKGVSASLHSFFFLTSILLAFISAYTAIDLAHLFRSSNKRNVFLYAGTIFSISFGFWVINFITIVPFLVTAKEGIDFFLLLLSMAIVLLCNSIAFLPVWREKVRSLECFLSSIFMTVSFFVAFFFCIYSFGASVRNIPYIYGLSALILLLVFFFSVWLMFTVNICSSKRKIWLKPVCAIFIAIAGTEGVFLLASLSPQFIMEDHILLANVNNNLFLYLLLFVIALILGSLIAANIFTTMRLSESDMYATDIMDALNAASIVAITDACGNITYVNDKFIKISQYQEHELIGRNHNIVNSGYHTNAFFKELWRTIGNGQIWNGEIRNKRKDGSYYWVDTTIVPFINKKGKPYQYLSIRNDITERKRTEEMIHRQDKLAAVGQLAAGVAHEIRNPMTSIKGYAEYLLLDENSKDKKELLTIIVEEIERVNGIVEDFMLLAKPNQLKIEEKNIIAIMDDVISLLDYDARKRNVHISFPHKQDGMKLKCDENRLKQVFLNIIKNGIEAMPDGGDLTVTCERDKTKIHITIHDTGEGIAEENLKKIGEPFYTTKKDGTGLGLMISFQIIENHHGKVYIESEVKKGTTFHIIFDDLYPPV
ncbi:PAS domain S-box protein [Bacillaceae bacterium Marseille-Q3522]|nr:PAS domain S-box protein [Bacillaceae bacterium Marseille-Q3522]